MPDLIFHIQYRPVYQISIGIGTVEDHQFFFTICTGFHQSRQRIDIGIKANTNILHIVDHDIYIGEVFFGWLILFSI